MSWLLRALHTSRWLEFARRDLRIVAALHADPTLFTAACVHAQQAAVKSLKAVLVSHDLSVPFTHDLAYLRRLVGDHLPPGPSQDDLDRLNRWGAAARYPGDTSDATADDIAMAERAAAAVFDHVATEFARGGLMPDG